MLLRLYFNFDARSLQRRQDPSTRFTRDEQALGRQVFGSATVYVPQLIGDSVPHFGALSLIRI